MVGEDRGVGGMRGRRWQRGLEGMLRLGGGCLLGWIMSLGRELSEGCYSVLNLYSAMWHLVYKHETGTQKCNSAAQCHCTNRTLRMGCSHRQGWEAEKVLLGR